MNVKHIMNPVHRTAPSQSMPKSGMNIGPLTGRTSTMTNSIMNASIPIMIQCIDSHCEKKAVYTVAIPLSWMALSTKR